MVYRFYCMALIHSQTRHHMIICIVYLIIIEPCQEEICFQICMTQTDLLRYRAQLESEVLKSVYNKFNVLVKHLCSRYMLKAYFLLMWPHKSFFPASLQLDIYIFFSKYLYFLQFAALIWPSHLCFVLWMCVSMLITTLGLICIFS